MLIAEQTEVHAADNAPRGGKGGNVMFRPGSGVGQPNCLPTDGDFIFKLPDGTEFLRIKPDGSFLVRGDKVAGDAKLYAAFAEWMSRATAELDDSDMVNGQNR